MFMVATEAWPDGINSKSDTTDEQLDTPRPEDVFEFEYGSFGGLEPSDINSSNDISKTNIINTNNYYNISDSSKHGSKMEQPYVVKTSPLSSPSSTLDEATAQFDGSWPFQPNLTLSPENCYLTPHQSPGVASPGSSSGGAEYRESFDFETSVNFNTEVVDSTEENNLSFALHDEIEQLSQSYCYQADNLISVNSSTNDEDSAVSPCFLKVLQEDSIPASDEMPPSVATDGQVFGTHLPLATSSDDDDKEDELEMKPGNDVTDATAWTQLSLHDVSSIDDTLDLKTQTQLEHNYYSIKPPLVDEIQRHNLTARTTVQPRETTTLQPPKRVQPSIKRQLLQRMHSEKMPAHKLKLKMPADDATVAPAGILNTPDLTSQLLELESEALGNADQFDLLAFIDSAMDYDANSSATIEPKPEIPPPAPASTTLSDLFNPAKRKLPMITIDNIDELTASSNPKKYRSATSSTTSSQYGDTSSEASSSLRRPKRRGRPPKQDGLIRDRSEYEHLSQEDLRYREQRDKNNEASRRSRLNRRDRELQLEREAEDLDRQYDELKEEERTLVRDCARWRRAVMRLALL